MHPFWTLVLLVCFAACGGGSDSSSSQLDSYETPGLPGR